MELVSDIEHECEPRRPVDSCPEDVRCDFHARKNDSSDVAAVALWKNMQREFVAIVESFLRGRELMRRCPVHEVVAVFEKERPFALSGQYSRTILDPRQQLASLHSFDDFLAIIMG